METFYDYLAAFLILTLPFLPALHHRRHERRIERQARASQAAEDALRGWDTAA